MDEGQGGMVAEHGSQHICLEDDGFTPDIPASSYRQKKLAIVNDFE